MTSTFLQVLDRLVVQDATVEHEQQQVVPRPVRRLPCDQKQTAGELTATDYGDLEKCVSKGMFYLRLSERVAPNHSHELGHPADQR